MSDYNKYNMTSININSERIYITAKQIYIAININWLDSFMF
jgi:hypothetical protein